MQNLVLDIRSKGYVMMFSLWLLIETVNYVERHNLFLICVLQRSITLAAGVVYPRWGRSLQAIRTVSRIHLKGIVLGIDQSWITSSWKVARLDPFILELIFFLTVLIG